VTLQLISKLSVIEAARVDDSPATVAPARVSFSLKRLGFLLTMVAKQL